MSLADYQTLVDDLVRDRDDVVSTVQRDAAIAVAVAQYSADRPREVVVDVTAVAAGQLLDLPAGFTDESRLVSIEFPVGVLPTQLLTLADIVIYASPTARQIVLPLTVTVGDVLRVTYTGEQMLDGTDDTVPARHRMAVASLAASNLCSQLASYYASEGEPTIAADTVDYKDKSERFRRLAKDLAATYTRVVGVAPSDRTKGASVTVQLERPNALGSRRMFHPTRAWPR